jgi:AraC-like DNA-binding protein
MGLEIGKVGFIQPVLEGLKRAGVNQQTLTCKSGLDRFNLDDPENYVPVNAMYRFLALVRKQEGITEFLETFSDQLHLASLSQWGEMIVHTPDVLTACRTAEKFNHLLLSHEQSGLETNGSTSRYWQRFTDKPAEGREQADFISFALAMSGFRLAGGPDWSPIEIHLQSNSVPNLDMYLAPGSNTRILSGQPETAIVFPTAMLAMPMLGEGAPSGLSDCCTSGDAGLAGKIRQLLDSINPDLQPVINLVSAMSDSSQRTLQRKLADEGTSFSEVVDQWRFTTAVQLLSDPGMRVKDISERLFYSNVPNFERAFRRWTNTSPNRYRDMQ